jgi:hypothetical protein
MAINYNRSGECFLGFIRPLENLRTGSYGAKEVMKPRDILLLAVSAWI